MESGYSWLNSTKRGSLRCYLPLTNISWVAKKSMISIDSFLRYYWSRNPVIWVAKPNQKWLPQMLPALDDYLHARNQRYWLILPSDIVHQRIVRSNWTRSTPGHIEPKFVVSDAVFLWWPAPNEKYKIRIEIFNRAIVDRRILLSD